MLELTVEQRQEVRVSGSLPLRVTDPDTHAEYVVVLADLFERMRRTFEKVDPSFFEFEEIEAPAL